jgi:hypothetical protein
MANIRASIAPLDFPRLFHLSHVCFFAWPFLRRSGFYFSGRLVFAVPAESVSSPPPFPLGEPERFQWHQRLTQRRRRAQHDRHSRLRR